MNSGPFETGVDLPSMHSANDHRLIVRARIQGMRIAAIWQVLLPFSRNIEKVKITTLPEDGFEQVTIALRPTPREALDLIVTRFNNMPWVTSTILC
ncbi:hypothetical protein FVF58_35110 [Paraburkholderia panacisoli]|uniref:Uncharacterized protein n=1 Tax=Paraburkholderia panacisoli TaxID=2603818 RepID=A0A5B0GP06_9BURK|nr:hypothetical protein [Paraburkholderia panacisoli]KAA1003700.1 hypothetical protein FVF58_35110 [Paraburkholderia panacisoli]